MLRPTRVLLAGALATAGALVGLAAPAQAAACSGTEGVTVVVDFGGTEQVGCAKGDPTSGTDALTKAGFGWTFHPREPGFICTIGGSPADQQCMKPNYWSYWHKSGGGWQYSNVGATQYDPAPGSTEGWSFGSQGIAPNGSTSNGIVESQPTVKPTPTPAPTRTPKPSPTTAAPGTGGSTGTGGGSTGGSGDGATGAGAAGQSAGARTERVTVTRPDGSTVTVRVTKKRAEQLRRQQQESPSATPTPSTAPSASASEQAESEAELAPAAARTEPGAGTVPWWWGAAALAGLAVVGGGAALLRRRGA